MVSSKASASLAGSLSGLRISATDFGPIAEADVHLRPLTVFVGPSDTGKSYLSILIYTLCRVLPFAYLNPYRTIARMQHSRSTSDPPDLREPVRKWLHRLARNGQQAKLPTQLADHLRAFLRQEQGLDDVIAGELERCFGLESLDDLLRVGSTPGRACFELRAGGYGDGSLVRYRWSLESGSLRSSRLIPDLQPMLARAHKRPYLPQELRTDGLPDDSLTEVSAWTLRAVHASLVKPIPQAYYLPADRAGIMRSHQVLVGTMIRNASSTGLRHSPRVPLLTGVFADFLSGLAEMAEPRRRGYRSKRGRLLAARMEEEVLNGQVRVDRSNPNYPSFAFRPKGWSKDLPFRHTSSTVSELAPVALFLRHTVHRGDLLIIEEPEAHLHPAKQAALTVALAQLVQAGIRLLVITHSDWVLEVLANLVRLSELPEGARSEFGDADCALTPEEVGVWLLFERSDEASGVKVRSLDLDHDTGLYPVDWDAVQEALYNTGARIHNRMADLRQR